MKYKILIKELREKLVLSQEEFASLLGVSFASVNRWENGHHEPTVKVKRKIIQLCKNINTILTRLDKQEEFNKTVLVALANLYAMEYSKRFRYRLKESEIRNGEYDDFPNFFKERINNNHE